jgi:hypothetical protein
MEKKDVIKFMIIETEFWQDAFGGRENWAFLHNINAKMSFVL